MTVLLTMLRDRSEEFDSHYALAVSLEEKIFGGEDISIGSTRLSVRHLLTMKSGLIVHLYNIIEAVMSQAMKIVGSAFGSVPPKSWSINARREWLREHGVARIEGGADTRLKQLESFSVKILADGPLGPQVIKKPPGSWSDENICLFAWRLGVDLQIGVDLRKKLATKPHLGDNPPLAFLAKRRNDLAHGHRSFEEGGQDLVLDQIREIADTAIEFMELVAIRFQTYVDHKQFVVSS